MPVTAHKATQRFHVDYDVTFEDRLVSDVLRTEALDIITTEDLLQISIEDFESKAHILRAQKIKRNTFIATVESTGSAEYFYKVLNIAPDNLVGYWPQWEASGSTAQDISSQKNNGAYTGVALGQPGIGDGRTCPSFGGIGFNNIYSTAFNVDFSGTEGTAIVWTKVNGSSTWTDGINRRAIQLFTNANDEIRILKAGANNTSFIDYRAGGTLKSVGLTAENSIGWITYGITWSKTNDKMIAYKNGAQTGSIQTGLGTWAGDLVSSRTAIGASRTTPLNVWDGYIAHVAIWDTPLTAAQIKTLSEV